MLYRFSFNHWLHLFLKPQLLILLITSLALEGTVFAQDQEPSNFKPNLINLEGSLGDPFRFQATLRNTAGQSEIFELKAELPEGWRANFTTMGSRITSVQIDPGAEKDITMEVFPSPSAQPGDYEIPLRASSPNTSYEITFQAVVTGAFDLDVTTPDDRLSSEVVSGSSKTFTLTLKNTGTLPLSDLEIESRLPSKWEAQLEPVKIEQLAPDKSADIQVHLKVPDKTIAGDYMAKFTVKNPNQQEELDYRLTVKTSLLSGWLGVLVILAALGLVYFLMRKYGRR